MNCALIIKYNNTNYKTKNDNSDNDIFKITDNTGEMDDVSPTNGFVLKQFKFGKAEIIAYDLGGGERIRSIWKNYYPEVLKLI